MSISPEDFSFVSELVRKESAIVLEAGKEYLVESRLGPLAKEEGMPDISFLVAQLRKSPVLLLKKKVVEALTTNETSFFRDLDPFEMLKKELLPELIQKRQRERHLRIWCAAVSTGQEIYSIAMTIRENFPELLNWNVELFGTDLSTEVLEKARRGIYSQIEVNRGLPAPMLVKYFEKQGMDWAVKPILKDMIKLSEMNLVKPWPRMPLADIVFIRNVLIYFDTEVKKEILGNIRKILRPDGYLFLGAAETTLNLDSNFERRSFARGGCYQMKPEE